MVGSTLAGAIGGYSAYLYTDKRRHKQVAKEKKRQFQEIERMMPELIREMKADLEKPEHETVRELFISPNRRVVINSLTPRFIYYEDEHAGLRNKVMVLENHGFVIDVTPGNLPMYRMTEELVEQVLASRS